MPTLPPITIGWILALIGLVVVVVLFMVDRELTREGVLGLFTLAFLSRLIP